MATVLKFLDEVKNKSFKEEPLTEGDIIVGSLFSYASFEITDEYKKYKLNEKTCKVSHFNKPEILDKMSKNYLVPKEFKKFLEPVLGFKRYKNLQIGYIKNYFEKNDPMQFFTFTIFTNNYNVIFFRGTDLSLLGWQENFNMVLEDSIPSWDAALNYVKEIASLNDRPIVIAGHSKGGNLAYYAYFNLPKEIKDRVFKVYNLDGPAFFKEEFKVDEEEFGKKVFKFVAEDDIVGILFERTNAYIPIDTKKRGVNAHDLLNWKFSKESGYRLLKRKKDITLTAKTFQITQNIWLNKLKKSEMKDLIDFIVSIATCNQMKDLLALKFDIIKARKVYLDEISNYDTDKKENLKRISKDLVKTFFTVLLHINDYNYDGTRKSE